MEQNTVRSHIKHGHQFILYTYNNISNIPEGTIVKDAREILPESEIFLFRKNEPTSFAAFSDMFRYKLLMDKGGWWVDMDLICLRPFDLQQEYVIASERKPDYSIGCAPGAGFKAPQNSTILKYCFNKCLKANKNNLYWGEIGPNLLTLAVKIFNLEEYIVPYNYFCPVDWFNFEQLLEPSSLNLSNSYGIHMWNDLWKRKGHDDMLLYNFFEYIFHNT